MTAKELAARLSLPGSLQQQVFSIPISPAQEQEWNELFLRDQEAFELRLHRHPTPELLALALYLRWAVATYRRYLTLGIPYAADGGRRERREVPGKRICNAVVGKERLYIPE